MSSKKYRRYKRFSRRIVHGIKNVTQEMEKYPEFYRGKFQETRFFLAESSDAQTSKYFCKKSWKKKRIHKQWMKHL